MSMYYDDEIDPCAVKWDGNDDFRDISRDMKMA